VLVVGSANVDYAVSVPRLPGPGETVSEGTLLVSHGGKGANQAVAARRLGADVRMLGCVGDDVAGDRVREALAGEGIGVDGVRVSSVASTGTALIIVDADGRNQIAVAPGANRTLSDADVTVRADDFEWADVLVCSLEVPLAAVVVALREARNRDVRTILNPAPVPPAGVDFWPLVDVATPNATEAARLSGREVVDEPGAREAAATLRRRGAGSVMVTLGADGVVAVTADGDLHVPAFAVTAVDTTAAGDAFNGALAVALAEGQPVDRALRFASGAAAIACTRRGAQPSLPGRGEVERLLSGAEPPGGTLLV
jgi:ribokinase